MVPNTFGGPGVTRTIWLVQGKYSYLTQVEHVRVYALVWVQKEETGE